jgi:hypothetical protein
MFCPKRSKIQLFNNPQISGKEHGAVSKGIKLHKQYEYMMYNIGFDRTLVKYKLGWTPLKVFEKQVKDTNIIIRGIPDDIRVIRTKDGTKYTVLIEVKTTGRRMIKREIYVAMKQLQLYMWLLKDKLEQIGFPLWKYGIVEVYSQKTGDLLKRYSVIYDDNIEEWIKHVVKTFTGEQPLKAPYDIHYCRKCPEAIRNVCSWHEMMKDERTKSVSM